MSERAKLSFDDLSKPKKRAKPDLAVLRQLSEDHGFPSRDPVPTQDGEGEELAADSTAAAPPEQPVAPASEPIAAPEPAQVAPQVASAPVAAPPPVPVIDVNPNAAPIAAPEQIVEESGFDLSQVEGVEGGIAGGIVGGIVGGLPSAPPPPPPPPPEPIRVGGNISAPTKTRDVPPQYPEVARAARVQGVVILEATIGATGNVTAVNVLRSVPLLDEAAVNAVRQWVYTPTLLNGVPVPVIMTVTVNFQLR